MYELGLGHPPAATLHRIAMVLGTTSSELLGERDTSEMEEQFDTMVRIYTDPYIGGVIRYMQDMPAEQRRKIRLIAAQMVGAQVETVKVMQ
jgi:hypothetical protein